MPIREYRCKKCNKRFEFLVIAGDEEEVKCPYCGSKKVEKELSVFSPSTNFCSPSGFR